MTFRRFAPVLAGTAALVVACSSGGGSSAISIDELSKPGNTCPVRLAAAAAKAGLPSAPVTGSVATPATSAPRTDLAAAAIARAYGVDAECGLALPGGGSLDLLLVAARVDPAVNLLIPKIVNAGRLSSDQVPGVLAAAASTKPGHLVPLPGSGPVAVAIVRVDGAPSAAFVLSSKELDRSHVEAVARDLAGDPS